MGGVSGLRIVDDESACQKTAFTILLDLIVSLELLILILSVH